MNNQKVKGTLIGILVVLIIILCVSYLSNLFNVAFAENGEIINSKLDIDDFGGFSSGHTYAKGKGIVEVYNPNSNTQKFLVTFKLYKSGSSIPFESESKIVLIRSKETQKVTFSETSVLVAEYKNMISEAKIKLLR